MQVVGALREGPGRHLDEPALDGVGVDVQRGEGVAQVGQPPGEPGLEGLAAVRRQAGEQRGQRAGGRIDGVGRGHRLSMLTP